MAKLMHSRLFSSPMDHAILNTILSERNYLLLLGSVIDRIKQASIHNPDSSITTLQQKDSLLWYENQTYAPPELSEFNSWTLPWSPSCWKFWYTENPRLGFASTLGGLTFWRIAKPMSPLAQSVPVRNQLILNLVACYNDYRFRIDHGRGFGIWFGLTLLSNYPH